MKLYDEISSQLSDQDADPKIALLYERLNKELDSAKEGLTSVELVDLTGTQKRVVMTMIRDSEAVSMGISLERLKRKLGDVPDDLLESLNNLAKKGWLIVLGEPPKVLFRIHMRRKRGSALGFGIWAAINEHLEK